MNKQTVLEKIKEFIGSIGWKLFIWSLNMTKEEYWHEIYLQEKTFYKDSI